MVRPYENKNYGEYFIKLYLDNIDFTEGLTADQERKLLSKYMAGDINALHELVNNSQYIIIKEVLKFIGKGVELGDLIQEANLACILAINNYSFDKGAFKNHLHRNIYRNLQNIVPGFYSPVCYPHNVLSEIKKLCSHQSANYTNQSVNKSGIEFDMTCFKYSLLHYLSMNDFDVDLKTIHDRIDADLDSFPQHTSKNPDDEFILMSLKNDLKKILKTIDEKEQKVIKWYYGLFWEKSLTFEEIGHKLNLTRERIRQIHDSGIRRLRHHSRSRYLREYLTLFYPDPELLKYEGFLTLHLGINMANEKNETNLLKDCVRGRFRKTPYPDISNIAEACRNLITDFLKQHGEPCSYNRIKEIVYEKYPLLNIGALTYALSTADDIINLKKGLYALKEWVFEDISKDDINNRSSEEAKKTYDTRLDLNKLSLKSIELTESQLNLINFFLENKGQLSKLKITVHSRFNHYDCNQLVNSINKQFVENFNEPLVKEENSNFFLNNKYLA